MGPRRQQSIPANKWWHNTSRAAILASVLLRGPQQGCKEDPWPLSIPKKKERRPKTSGQMFHREPWCFILHWATLHPPTEPTLLSGTSALVNVDPVLLWWVDASSSAVVFICFFLWNMVLLCSPGWPQTHDPPASLHLLRAGITGMHGHIQYHLAFQCGHVMTHDVWFSHKQRIIGDARLGMDSLCLHIDHYFKLSTGELHWHLGFWGWDQQWLIRSVYFLVFYL
jgi:hypothetical protein